MPRDPRAPQAAAGPTQRFSGGPGYPGRAPLGQQQQSSRNPGANYGPPQPPVDAAQSINTEMMPEPWAPAAAQFRPGEDDRTMPATLPPAEAAAPVPSAPAGERKSLNRRDIALALGLYLLSVVAAFGWAYDLFAKLFDLVHNRCTAKKDFSVQCIVIRPPASALWGLLIGGGGMFLALVGAMVLASVAAMTGRRAWIWTAIALPLILVAGAAGHVLVATAIS
ncbi:hypothetical protein ACWCW7_17310 [Nocardia tengchongensis]